MMRSSEASIPDSGVGLWTMRKVADAYSGLAAIAGAAEPKESGAFTST